MTTRATRNYTRRFVAALASYAVLLALGIWLANLAGPSPWRFAAMLLPVPGLLAVVWAVWRYVREADEMQARDLVESLAIGFGGGSALTFSYGLLQTVGAPPINWMMVWVVYAACWLAGSLVTRMRRR